MRHLLLGLLFYVVLFAAPLNAAFILDDFDDPAEVVSPEMEGMGPETAGVGGLSADRTLSIFDIFTDPVARLDSGLSRSSHLTGLRSPADPLDRLGLMRMGPIYRFDGVPHDFTGGDQNDAILIDFTSLTGPSPPPLLFGFVQDNGAFFEIFFNLESFSAPGIAVLPFDQFRERAGGSRTTDFESVTRFSFSVTGNGRRNCTGSA